MKPRRQDVYRLSLHNVGNTLIKSVCVNTYLLPGALWVYRAECRDGWHVRQEYLGKGHVNCTHCD